MRVVRRISHKFHHCGVFGVTDAFTLEHHPDGHQDDFEIQAMCAIGIRASKDILPPEIAEREVVSDRRPLEEIVMEGKFRK